jgi:hypothetical protein
MISQNKTKTMKRPKIIMELSCSFITQQISFDFPQCSFYGNYERLVHIDEQLGPRYSLSAKADANLDVPLLSIDHQLALPVQLRMRCWPPL